MAEQWSIYRCPECNSMVEILRSTSCDPSCCGHPMELVPANADQDEGVQKKHQLVAVASENNSIVKVGAMGHPMKKDHHIEWVEIISACKAHHRRFLKPGDEPEAWFLPPAEHVVSIRAYCSKDGLWTKNWK